MTRSTKPFDLVRGKKTSFALKAPDRAEIVINFRSFGWEAAKFTKMGNRGMFQEPDLPLQIELDDTSS